MSETTQARGESANGSNRSPEVLAPRTKEPEFGGLPGALFVTISVPLTLLYLTVTCDEELGCSLGYPLTHGNLLLEHAKNVLGDACTDSTAWLVYFGWYAYTVLAWFVLPGKWVEGLPLRTGERLKYKVNGRSSCCAAILTCSLPDRSRGALCHHCVHCCLRAGELHVPVPPLGRAAGCCDGKCLCAGDIRVRLLVPKGQAARARRQHGKCRLRCESPQSGYTDISGSSVAN